MITLRVSDVRKCMNEFLCKDTFDFFLLQEATVKTFGTFIIDGHRLDDYYTKEELQEMDSDDSLVSYDMIREHLYDVIKGTKVPLSFQIILSLPNRLVAQIIDKSELDYDSLGVNMVAILRFVNGELTITSGTSFTEFIMDKSLECVFDKWLNDFFNAAEIETDKIA